MKIQIPCQTLTVESGRSPDGHRDIMLTLGGVDLDGGYLMRVSGALQSDALAAMLGSENTANMALDVFEKFWFDLQRMALSSAKRHARLCDASPAMLKAMKRAVDVMECDCEGVEDETCERCEMVAAIAEATEEAPDGE